jgi:hypothetical protein
VDDPLAELILPLLPYSDISTEMDARRIADAIRGKPQHPDEVFGFWFKGIWQPVLVGVTVEAVSKDQVTFHYPPPGHIRERIDPRRDIEPRGYVRCTKCQVVVAYYSISDGGSGELVVTYEPPFTPPPPCID